MASVNKVWVPVVPNSKGFRKEVLEFLKTLERQIELTVRLVLDDKGLAEQMRRQQEKTQRQSDRSPVEIPVEPEAPEDVVDAAWRARLRRELENATKGIEANIPAGVDGEHLRRQLRDDYEAAVRGLDAEIPVDAVEADRFRHHVDELVKKINGRHAEINADADTAAAEAQLKLAARDRRVEFVASVSQRSIAGVATFLSAVSGARVASDAIKGLGERLQNLDRSVPRVAGLSLAIGSLGATAISSVGGIATFITSLAPLAGLAAPLPGLLLAGGTAMGVLVAALKDGGEQLSSLGPLFTKLQDGISKGFWEQARQPILDLVRNTFPALQAGLNDVATSLGKWAASVAGSFEDAFSPEVIDSLTGPLARSIEESTRGTDAFAQSIAQLGVFSSQYLPALGRAFSDVAIVFNDWLADVISDGRLTGWVQDGIGVLKQLGSIAGSVFGIIGDISSAAARAGSSGLNTLANAMKRIDDLASTPAFQGALETIFTGAGKGAAGLANGLSGVGRLLEGLSGSISTALDVLGTTAGDLLGGIADALNQPVVAQGIIDAVNGISDGVEGLLPALPDLGRLLGNVLTLFGDLAGAVGPVLGAALSAVAPLFEAIVEQVGPLAQELGPILVDMIEELAPVLADAAKELGPMAQEMLPEFVDLVKELVPLMQVLAPILAEVIPPLAKIGKVMGETILEVLKLVIPFLTELIKGFGPPLITAVMVAAAAFQAFADVMNGDPISALGEFGGAIEVLKEQVGQNLQNITDFFSAFFGSMPAGVQSTIASFGQLPTSIGVAITSIAVSLAGGALEFGRFVQGLGQGVATALGTFGRLGAGVLSTVGGVFTSAWAQARAIVSTSFSVIGGAVSSGGQAISSGIRAGVGAVPGLFQTAFAGLGSIVSGAIGQVRSVLSSLPGTVSSAVGNLGGILVGAGRSIIDGLVNGIRGALGNLRSMLGSVTSMIPEWKGPPRTDARLLVNNGRLIMGGRITGIRDRTGDLKSTLRDVTAAIPSYGMSTSLGDDMSAGAFAFPDGVTLMDSDGSILARTRVIASDAVSQGNESRSQQLSAGLNRRYA